MTMSDQTDRDPTDGEYEYQAKVITAAHQLAAVIARCEVPLADKLLADLNQKAIDLELVGQPVIFSTDTVEWMREDFNFETGEATVDEYTDLPTKGSFAATVTGFDRIGTEKGDVLLYKLQYTAMDKTQSAFISAFTPVIGTKLQFVSASVEQKVDYTDDPEADGDDEEFVAADELPAYSKALIERLRTVRDGDFQEDLTDFLELHRKITYPSSEKIRELGILATNLMAYDYIEADPEARKWLLMKVLSLFTMEKAYHIGGHFIADDPSSKKELDPFRQASGKYRVIGAAFIPDYEVSFEDISQSLQGETTQVALTVTSDKGEAEFVPIRYISAVSDWSRHYLGKSGCTEARLRFLEETHPEQ